MGYCGGFISLNSDAMSTGRPFRAEWAIPLGALAQGSVAVGHLSGNIRQNLAQFFVCKHRKGVGSFAPLFRLAALWHDSVREEEEPLRRTTHPALAELLDDAEFDEDFDVVRDG
jgi:hypothetical protein